MSAHLCHSGRLLSSLMERNKAAKSLRLLAAFVLFIASDSWSASQDLELGILIRGQLEDHQGVSKAESQPIEESASLPLAQVHLEGIFAPRSDIYVAFQADDTQLKLQEAYVGYLIAPEHKSNNSSPSRSLFSRVNGEHRWSDSGLWLHAGRMPESFGLQNQSRPQQLILMTPSIASSSITESDKPEGIRLSYLSDQVTTQVGIFHHRNTRIVGDDHRPWSGSLRLAGRTLSSDSGQLQFGVSLGLKDIFVGSRWLESPSALDKGFRDSALNTPFSLFSSESNAIDSEQRGALEFVWHRNGVTVQSESFYRQINGVHDGVAASLNGHYLEISWLTKGERRYFNRQGILQLPKPTGAWGSFEWITGVDSLNLNRSDSTKMVNYYSWFLGHNWYANPNVKVYSLWRYSKADAEFVVDQHKGFGHGVRLGAELSI